VHDNGPLFESPAALTGRGLTVRAARGYRPLLVWDLQRTLDEARRKAGRRPAEAAPLALFSVSGGGLTLEGLDVVLKWPEGESGPAALLHVRDGDLTARDCTFSVAGKHREGVALARVRGDRPGPARCRFDRCFARGRSLVALDLDAPGAQVLFDGCLVVGGEPPLLAVRADGQRGVTLRVVRSTIVCGRTLLALRPAQAGERNPALDWLGWDALLSRSGTQEGGDLVAVGAGAETANMKWRAYNCVYAGWHNLLAGATTIPAAEANLWRRHWARVDGDVAARATWPAAAFSETAERAASTYRTAGTPVGFAASASGGGPLGCDLAALPPARDDWLALTYERFATPPPDVLADSARPQIPASDGQTYHGERLDLGGKDLGAYLEQVVAARPCGKRLVLHVSGTGEHAMKPLRLQGRSLTLFFEPPAEGADPPTLTLSTRGRVAGDALIEVDGGSLDVIGGDFRLPGLRSGQPPPFLFKVRGGNLRLHRCRLRGPVTEVPDSYRGLISLEGSGDPAADRACLGTANETVLVSGRDGVHVRGVGARLLLRQTLLVAGGDGIRVEPGEACKDRANVQCLLERTTVAAKRAVVALADTPSPAGPGEPVVVQTRASAFLNPFTPRPNRAGLLVYDGDALTHGLLAWQSDEDVLDRRLHFGAAPARALPDRPEGLAAWLRLWGSAGVRRPVFDLRLTRTLEAGRWPLERLALPPGRGADLVLLGVVKKR
jgi:hypothetical protein